jgi:hypothetical protein
VLGIADDDDLSPAIPPMQLAAALSPSITITELVGNFADLDRLLEQLSHSFVIELGNPVPKDKYMPRQRAGACPSMHNKWLIGEEGRRNP